MVVMSRLETESSRSIKPCSIYETLGRAVAAIVPKAEKKKIGIYVDCPENLMLCHDSKWTEEAIFNILDNAVKYTKKTARLRVEYSDQRKFCPRDAFLRRSLSRILAKDLPWTGRAEIFRRFYREPEIHDQEGIGVGLYLARKIITVCDGYIDVQSEPGKVRFRIFLPNNSKESYE